MTTDKKETLKAEILQIPMIIMRVNAPEWYEDEGFLRWLNTRGAATWHHSGEDPNEFSDAFFTYDQGNGSDWPGSDEFPGIPDHIWKQVEELVADTYGGHAEVLVWVSNLR